MPRLAVRPHRASGHEEQRLFVRECCDPRSFLNICDAENKIQEPFIEHAIKVRHVHLAQHHVNI